MITHVSNKRSLIIVHVQTYIIIIYLRPVITETETAMTMTMTMAMAMAMTMTQISPFNFNTGTIKKWLSTLR